MTTNVLACDPGRCSGWALFVDGKLRASGHFSIRSTKGAIAILGVVSMASDVMVIEGCHHPSPKMGWKTLFGMGVARGQWEQLARMRGLKIVEVRPNEWQYPTIGKGRRKQQIAKYVARAEQIAKRKPVQPDEAAAIVLGDWYVREQGRK